MAERSELSVTLEEIVARAVDPDPPRPRRSVPFSSGSADVDGGPTGPSLPYRAARKAYQLALRPQMHVNDAVLGRLGALEGADTSIAVQLASLQAQLASAEAELVTARTEMASTQVALARIEGDATRLREAVELLAGSRSEIVAALDAPIERLDDMYEAFELEYRGSVEEITERLRVYLDYVYPLPEHGGPVLDLGCGRGEWLTLLRDSHIAGMGIDLNADFVKACRGGGLDVRLADLRIDLGARAAESLGVVTAFHLVEHLDMAVLVDLVDQAMRVLRPGGLLIMETPNPTNLAVGAAAFYRDPTHRRPVHPDFLAFLARHAGFDPVDVVFLHPVEDGDRPTGHPGDVDGADAPGPEGPGSSGPDAPEVPEDLWTARMRWALGGPQDYAVVATKPPG